MKVTDQELIDAIQDVPEPVASAREVAERVEIGKKAVNKRLNILEGDCVEKKDTGRGYVWWVSEN